jgi:hypothetical protein
MELTATAVAEPEALRLMHPGIECNLRHEWCDGD